MKVGKLETLINGMDKRVNKRANEFHKKMGEIAKRDRSAKGLWRKTEHKFIHITESTK
jgi:hypothetical protein